MYLRVYTFKLHVCEYIHICTCAQSACVCACVACLHVALETCVRKGERSSVQDGNKIKLFFLNRFRVGASCLSNFVSSAHLFQHWCLGVLD